MIEDGLTFSQPHELAHAPTPEGSSIADDTERRRAGEIHHEHVKGMVGGCGSCWASIEYGEAAQPIARI